MAEYKGVIYSQKGQIPPRAVIFGLYHGDDEFLLTKHLIGNPAVIRSLAPAYLAGFADKIVSMCDPTTTLAGPEFIDYIAAEQPLVAFAEKTMTGVAMLGLASLSDYEKKPVIGERGDNKAKMIRWMMDIITRIHKEGPEGVRDEVVLLELMSLLYPRSNFIDESVELGVLDAAIEKERKKRGIRDDLNLLLRW